MRELFAVAIVAIVASGFIKLTLPAGSVGDVLGFTLMDARPIVSNLPPIPSRLGAVPHFIGPLPSAELRWRIHARVKIGSAVQDSYTYSLHAGFADEDSCKAFADTDQEFRDAVAVLLARGKAIYGGEASVEVTCELD